MSDRREIHKYKPIRIGARVEGLDLVCYALAVRQACTHVNLPLRARKMNAPSPTRPKGTMGERYGRLERRNNNDKKS